MREITLPRRRDTNWEQRAFWARKQAEEERRKALYGDE